MVRTAPSMKSKLPILMALTAGLGCLPSASAADPAAAPSRQASGPTSTPTATSASPIPFSKATKPAKTTATTKPAPTLKDADGKTVDPLADHGQKATLLFFLTTECSIGNGYAPEIARIADEFRGAGIVCYAVYAHESAAEIRKHLADFKLPLLTVMDPTLSLATLTGATVTPEACLLTPAGTILYRGRIDDRAVKIGTVRSVPRVLDLRLALDAVRRDKPVPVRFTKAIGCYLDFPPAPGK